MDADFLLKAVVAMAPVILLLLVFDRLDVFNLIPLKTICALGLAGGSLAALSFLASWRILDGFPIGFTVHSRYVAPPLEEALKALPVIWLFFRNRVGFKLDAAIAGFAVGAGFSVVENAWYLNEYVTANFSAWLVRGFGTAIMHGGATALFAVISHEMTETQAEAAAARYRFNPLLFLPGFGIATAIHAAFNHFPHQPLAVMAITLFLTPATLFITLARAERATHEWLKDDRESHARLLDDIRAGRFAASPAGEAIHRLSDRIAGTAAEDVFAFVELKTALILRAEELMLERQHDPSADVSDADHAAFERLDALRRRLGRPIIAAVSPYLGFSRNDLFELDRLRARARARARQGRNGVRAPG